jgi:phosphoenolpyruvate carboxylase
MNIQPHSENAAYRKERKIAATFRKCGLDPYDEEKRELAAHLQDLAQSSKSIYRSLIKNQQAESLTE